MSRACDNQSPWLPAPCGWVSSPLRLLMLLGGSGRFQVITAPLAPEAGQKHKNGISCRRAAATMTSSRRSLARHIVAMQLSLLLAPLLMPADLTLTCDTVMVAPLHCMGFGLTMQQPFQES